MASKEGVFLLCSTWHENDERTADIGPKFYALSIPPVYLSVSLCSLLEYNTEFRVPKEQNPAHTAQSLRLTTSGCIPSQSRGHQRGVPWAAPSSFSS